MQMRLFSNPLDSTNRPWLYPQEFTELAHRSISFRIISTEHHSQRSPGHYVVRVYWGELRPAYR